MGFFKPTKHENISEIIGSEMVLETNQKRFWTNSKNENKAMSSFLNFYFYLLLNFFKSYLYYSDFYTVTLLGNFTLSDNMLLQR